MEISTLNNYTDKAIEMVMLYAPNVLLALVVLIIGLWIIGRIVSIAGKMMKKRDVDESLQPFLKSLISIGLKAMLIISVAGMVGIETTSFVAVIGAAGLAVGLALQGTLANFAGGVLLLLFKPIKVGDFIKAQGHIGTVKEIQIFVTVLQTPDQETVFIPNGVLSNGDITNYSTSGTMRVNLEIGIAYDSDVVKAKSIIQNVMDTHPLVLKDPAPVIGVFRLDDSAVTLAVKPYSTTDDYWTVWFDISESCLKALKDGGVEIPFPQMDVHMQQS